MSEDTLQIKAPSPFIWDARLGDDEKAEIARLNKSLERLAGMRAVQINVSGHFAKSKIAWKLACHQHALLHRIVDLVDGAAIAWNNQCILTAMLSARAFMETFALMADFKQAVERHLRDEDLAVLDALAQKGMFATRDSELVNAYPDIKATNAVTYIDKFDKQVRGFREYYDTLSEFCHPNFLGHNFMFSTLNRTNGTVDFTTGKEIGRHGQRILGALISLPLVEMYMVDLDRTIKDIADFHHRIAPVGR